ncbi:unnamed protein product [Rotaria sp. Silwood2]|nr:unnamed protein product [Rotaria sp. Silwood2]CAF4114843.1 unnamed protein product [Rotaria sp. Silwood2]CAF4451285.1 unnamed protein product [Rotaria sp. Silwood2]
MSGLKSALSSGFNNECIHGEENRFNYSVIQMNGDLSTCPITIQINAIQQRLNTLYSRYEHGDIDANELFDEPSYAIAKNIV